MARGDTINVIGIEKVTKDLDKLFSEFKTKRKIVDKSSRDALKPMMNEARAHAPIAEADVPAWRHRKAIPRGTLQKAIRLRKRKNWLGLIIAHGPRAKHDAWFWRFPEYGWVHHADGKFKQPRSFGKFRALLAGTQKRVLNKWLRVAQKEMKSRIPKMDTKVK